MARNDEQKTTYQQVFKELTSHPFTGDIVARRKSRDVPVELITDAPTICLIANKRWWAHIAGMVDLLTERRAWESASDENAHAIQQILEFMDGVTCLDFQLRQSPTDPCILEQSLDGGETWIDAYNFLLCDDLGAAGAQNAIEQQTNQNQTLQDAQDAYDNFLQNYVDDITDLYPALGYDGTQNDGDRDRALCYALTKFVDAVCESSIRFYEEISESAIEGQRAAAVAAAALGVAAVIATGGGALFAAALLGSAGAALGLSSAFADTIWKFWNNNTQDAFEDLQAREDVVCYAYENMKGANATQLSLSSAFDGLTGSDNAIAIAGACAEFAAQSAMYAVFVEALNYGYNAGKLGLLPGCACETELSVYEIDFASGDLSAYEILVGTQVAGGVKGIDIGVGFLLARVQMSIPNEMELHEIEMEYTRTDGSTSVDDKHVVSSWPDQEQDGIRTEWLGASGLNDGLRVECASNVSGRIARVVRFDATVNDTPTGEIIIHRVKIVIASPAPLGQIDADYELCP